jgi:ADP-heptose:LPS heptosyltransferase
VPWLDGALLRYLSAGSVLDIKAADDPDQGLVVIGATKASLAQFEAAADAAVFSKDALSAARDPGAMLAAWFRLLRLECFMVIVLPHDGLHADPAARAMPFAPAATAAPFARPRGGACPPISRPALLRLIEAALPAGSFEIVELSESPGRRPAGSGHADPVDIRLVLRKCLPKVAPTGPPTGLPPTAPAVADISIPFMQVRPSKLKTPGMRAEDGLLIRDFAPWPPQVRRILVLKLDHHGDFVIGLPALRELRQSFPEATIRLVCGAWNAASARGCGLVDEVRSFDYFPERAAEWTGASASSNWALFAAATDGYVDIAIDLRVDEDTRALLGRVDAGLRCGIGSPARFPMLDVVLPEGPRDPVALPAPGVGDFSTSAEGLQSLAPAAFDSAMDLKTPLYHESRFTSSGLHSGKFLLPEGEYLAEFDLTAHGFVPGIFGCGVTIEVMADDHRLCSKVFGRRSIAGLSGRDAWLRFTAPGKPSTIAFRVTTEGRPLRGRLRFAGLRLRRLDANGARYAPSELHVGEKLSLLVSLIQQRVLGLNPPAPVRQPQGRRTFAIAPFSNSTIRDWPVAYYAELIGLLAETGECGISLLGAPGQATQADALMGMLAGTAAEGRVTNLVGQTAWSELVDILRAADLVICNNSGIAHQAALLDARTLAIYSASHQPMEWGPRGRHARALMVSVACSPCGYERIEHCVNDHLCMRLITPAKVMAQIDAMLGGSRPAALACSV